ncbi:hypothetical protein EV696_102120 [Permianibacter aggregans]|uniref:Uncharacterized protein n=1 Tax=Permianibacter aggregans TaxID=1510150 RepID=A0A4R6UWR6_9GAMM|nr:hypothetical protein EV696_102120 [Permianibacter aggregans]
MELCQFPPKFLIGGKSAQIVQRPTASDSKRWSIKTVPVSG